MPADSLADSDEDIGVDQNVTQRTEWQLLEIRMFLVNSLEKVVPPVVYLASRTTTVGFVNRVACYGSRWRACFRTRFKRICLL